MMDKFIFKMILIVLKKKERDVFEKALKKQKNSLELLFGRPFWPLFSCLNPKLTHGF